MSAEQHLRRIMKKEYRKTKFPSSEQLPSGVVVSVPVEPYPQYGIPVFAVPVIGSPVIAMPFGALVSPHRGHHIEHKIVVPKELAERGVVAITHW